ncbi:MAG: mechanosensitive ion channel [Sphingomonadaceae bacterium]|nr:mechanosensitive ion channel [Sphingomonadaceae bacterium]
MTTESAPQSAGSVLTGGGEFLASAQRSIAIAIDQIWSIAALQQLLALLAAVALGYLLSRRPVRYFDRLRDEQQDEGGVLYQLYRVLARICWPVAILVLLWIAAGVFDAFDQPSYGLRITASLLNALIVVRVLATLMGSGPWRRVFQVLAWAVAALYILGWLDPVTEALESAAIEISGFRLSLLRILTTLLVIVIAFWVARLAGDAAQARLRVSKRLTPSLAGLLGQLAKIAFMVIAVLVALSAAGINLTALTVLSGAIGVGIGFGLQAIFSNFISGIIILFEKSVKVGDFIELESGVTGLVTEISIRSTKVTTNDNVDILVPNEEFIKAQVTNWTLSEAKRRLRIPFGVAYGTDKELVKKAGLEAASKLDWIHDDGGQRAPQVWLTGFGDSSLDFELVVWLTDEATKRPAKVNADAYWELHSALEKYEIEIPFPQRDLHLKTPEKIQIEN